MSDYNEQEGAGGPAFELAGISNTVGCPVLAFFAKGGSRECPRNFVDPCRVATNQIAHAASPPTLAKNARMGHPLLEMVHTEIAKGGPPAQQLQQQQEPPQQ